MIKANDQIVVGAMKPQCGHVQDPNASPVLPKRRRIEMVDEIPRVLTASVVAKGGTEHQFKVIAIASAQAKLSFELTNSNIELLLKEPEEVPKEEVEAFEPIINEENVFWHKQSSAVMCKYRDNITRKFRNQSFKVTPSVDA